MEILLKQEIRQKPTRKLKKNYSIIILLLYPLIIIYYLKDVLTIITLKIKI